MSYEKWYDDPQYIPDNDRDLEEGEAAVSLREAWRKIYGEYPSDRSLALLWAQSALETGRWKSIHCFNFGNIRKVRTPDDGHLFCMYEGNEIIKGKAVWFKPPEPLSHFRGYKSAIDGAEDYIRLVSQKKRYTKAWQKVIEGDPMGYVYELKKAGYFTASVEKYAKPVVSLTNEFLRRRDELLAWEERDTDPAPPNFEEDTSSDADPISDTDPSTFEPEELIKTEPWNPPIEFEKEPDIYDPEPETKEKDPTFGMVAIFVAVASALYVYLSMMFPGCF